MAVTKCGYVQNTKRKYACPLLHPFNDPPLAHAPENCAPHLKGILQCVRLFQPRDGDKQLNSLVALSTLRYTRLLVGAGLASVASWRLCSQRWKNCKGNQHHIRRVHCPLQPRRALMWTGGGVRMAPIGAFVKARSPAAAKRAEASWRQ